MATITIGQTAPDFSLYNTNKEKVTLSKLQGKKILLLFFPAAFTGVCTTELCSIRDGIADYNALQTTVFGISVDSLFTLAKFKEEQKLNFDLLSDFNATACESYGCKYDNFVFDMQNVCKRSAFVIDENLKIIYAEILESAGDLPHFDAIKQVLN